MADQALSNIIILHSIYSDSNGPERSVYPSVYKIKFNSKESEEL